jgi:hypothetical protein
MSQQDDILIEAFVAEQLGNSSYLIGSRQTKVDPFVKTGERA